MEHQIDKEGHPTYGGLSGRDIMKLAAGLNISTKEEYVTYRINQVRDFGDNLKKHGLPILSSILSGLPFQDCDMRSRTLILWQRL